MSIFGDIFNFIKSLVVRSGLKEFLKKNQTIIIAELEELAMTYHGQPLNDWRDEAFSSIRQKLSVAYPKLPDNWVMIGLSLGWEVIKAKAEKQQLNS